MSKTNLQTINTEHSQDIESYFNDWQRYQKIVDNNYMRHQELYEHLKNIISQHFNQPFSMLELGCGDAAFTCKTLMDTSISSYKGVDLSSQALELAKQNLAKLNCHKTLNRVIS